MKNKVTALFHQAGLLDPWNANADMFISPGNVIYYIENEMIIFVLKAHRLPILKIGIGLAMILYGIHHCNFASFQLIFWYMITYT